MKVTFSESLAVFKFFVDFDTEVFPAVLNVRLCCRAFNQAVFILYMYLFRKIKVSIKFKSAKLTTFKYLCIYIPKKKIKKDVALKIPYYLCKALCLQKNSKMQWWTNCYYGYQSKTCN